MNNAMELPRHAGDIGEYKNLAHTKAARRDGLLDKWLVWFKSTDAKLLPRALRQRNCFMEPPSSIRALLILPLPVLMEVPSPLTQPPAVLRKKLKKVKYAQKITR